MFVVSMAKTIDFIEIYKTRRQKIKSVCWNRCWFFLCCCFFSFFFFCFVSVFMEFILIGLSIIVSLVQRSSNKYLMHVPKLNGMWSSYWSLFIYIYSFFSLYFSGLLLSCFSGFQTKFIHIFLCVYYCFFYLVKQKHRRHFSKWVTWLFSLNKRFLVDTFLGTDFFFFLLFTLFFFSFESFNVLNFYIYFFLNVLCCVFVCVEFFYHYYYYYFYLVFWTRPLASFLSENTIFVVVVAMDTSHNF